MSLVAAFIGISGSVVAGDMREIILWGDFPRSDRFEEELYSGQIRTDEEMHRRARELGIRLGVRDTKRKVWERDGVLIGEVSDFEHGLVRKRRLYVTTGRYALAEIEGSRFSLNQRGEASRFVVLGNPFTQQIANRCIRERWQSGGYIEAAHLVQEIMKEAARKSASVSREHVLLRTIDTVDLDPLIERDQGRALFGKE
jgi:hypothetical protein